MQRGILRRNLLLAPAALPAAAGVKRPPAPPYDVLAEIRRYRKLDSHNHIHSHEPRVVIAAADRLHIEKVAISVPLTNPNATPADYRDGNDRVLRAMKDYPGRFLGQCGVNPNYGRESLEEITRCMDSGMIGLGEMYTQVRVSDPKYYPIVEKCIQLKAPLLVHAGGSRERNPSLPGASIADDFVEIGNRYPEALIIYGHIGGGGDWEYACKTLRAAPSVFADTSGSVTDEGMVDLAVQYLGVSRLLFATDMNFETGVGKVLAAKLTDAERRRVFFDNFNDILRRRGNHVR